MISQLTERTQKIVEEYWLKTLGDVPAALRLPTVEHAPSGGAAAATITGGPLSPSASELLVRISKESDLGLFVLLLTATSVVLSRYAGADDFVVGTTDPTDNAERPILIRQRIAGEAPVRALVETNRRTVVEALNHSGGDFAEIVRRIQSGGGRDPFSAVTIGVVYDRLHGRVQKPDWCELLIVFERAGSRLSVRAEHVRAVHDIALLERLLRNILHVLEDLPATLDRAVRDVDVLCRQERDELLAFNRTRTGYPRHRTVPDLFDEQVVLNRDAPAIVSDTMRLSYRELNEKANGIAGALRSHGVSPADRVALVAEPGADAVVAMLAAAKVGACYVPIDPRDPEARVRTMLETCGPRAVLTTRSRAETTLRRVDTSRVLCVDDAATRPEPSHPESPARAEDPLCVMYTSGTSGRPNGVLVEHRGIVRLAKNPNVVEWRPDDCVLAWSPLDFDASTFEIWGALLNGLPLCLATREQVLDPDQLRAVIDRHHVTTLWLPAPLFAQLAAADLAVFGRLRTLIAGGDVVSPVHASRVRHQFPQLAIVNGYGPTEATTFSTTHRIEREYTAHVPIGRPIANSTAYVVDAVGNLQPVGVVGELLVGGDGVAKGYLNDPALTRERFVPFLDEERVYKTGDLARWSTDGALEFCGRVDDQVKVRGYRIEPGEIEARLLSHPAVQYAAVLAYEDRTGDKALCAYVVCPEADAGRLKTYLAEALPDYMVPARIVRVDRLPLTPHGKVDRTLLPPPSPQSAGERRDARDATERRMKAVWEEVLGTEGFGIDDDFFELGGHSMKAIRLISLIHREFGVRIGLQQVLKSMTVAQLATVVRDAAPSPYLTVERAPDQEFYELSVSQTRLAELYAADPENAAFNISQRFTCGAAFDRATAEQVVAVLTARHESLRTRFDRIGGRYVQRIDPSAPLAVETIDLSGVPADEQEQRRREVIAGEEALPFRLEVAPLYRVKCLTLGAGGFDVLWTMHHIVSDGWSMDVIQREFLQLYECGADPTAAGLEPIRLRYRDYVVCHNRLLADAATVARAKAFWRDLLGPPLRMLPLPYDFPRAASSVGRRSAGYHAVIPADLTGRLRTVAKHHDTSLFLVLFAGYNRLLAELAGDRDVITGIPSANRYHEDLKNVVGFLVDSVVIRTPVDVDQPLSALIDRVADNTLRILDHAYYPIELACRAVDTTWPDILSTFFNMATFGDVNRRVLDDTGWYPIERVQAAKLEFVVYLTEFKNGVEVNAHYYTDLFRPATIEGAMRRYAAILEAMADADV